VKKTSLRGENFEWHFDGTGHLEGVMKRERNQLTSVGQRRIWSLADALPEKEVFQSARIFRNGVTKPLFAGEAPSFHSTLAVTFRSEENRGVTLVRSMQVAKASATSCNALHTSDVDHMPYASPGSSIA
jgi:hypothetical protein